MSYISPHSERLSTIAEALKNGESVPPVTVRTFLQWFFNTQRRGRWIVGFIRANLTKLGLRTIPDFESAYLGAEIVFELVRHEKQPDEIESAEVVDSVKITEHAEVRVVALVFDDPTYRISKLGAANHSPVAVKPDSTIAQAVTLMMKNDFSQLPVMTNDRDVKGIVSWKSIGQRLALGQSPVYVREAMDPHAEVSGDASLFSVIGVIVDHDYALVRASDKRIIGIITTSDLSLQFEQLSEPFLLLGEIENHIRKILGSKFTKDQLAAAKNPSDENRLVEDPSDLTFGEYQRLLESPDAWKNLDLKLDRAIFVDQLEKVREIRNSVMHFDPDGIEDEAREALRDFAKFLRLLDKICI